MTAQAEIQEIAVITGASTGIGAATARELARRGFHVLAGVRRDQDAEAIRGPAHELVSAMTPEQSQRYAGLVQAVNRQAVSSTRSGLPADAAAKVIAKAITTRRPRTRYTVGRDAALLTRLARILPDRMLDRLFAAALRPHFPKESK
jgi:NAD(P)-dependent dehydrogenase (short-subunit alcohol dehydrogenase family)